MLFSSYRRHCDTFFSVRNMNCAAFPASVGASTCAFHLLDEPCGSCHSLDGKILDLRWETDVDLLCSSGEMNCLSLCLNDMSTNCLSRQFKQLVFNASFKWTSYTDVSALHFGQGNTGPRHLRFFLKPFLVRIKTRLELTRFIVFTDWNQCLNVVNACRQ